LCPTASVDLQSPPLARLCSACLSFLYLHIARRIFQLRRLKDCSFQLHRYLLCPSAGARLQRVPLIFKSPLLV
jgi:hypothetical protein